MKKSNGLSVSVSVMLISALALLLSGCSQKDVTVWVASPWQRVMQTTPPGDLQEANLKAACNEYEPFRLIIHNHGDRILTGLNVTVSNLKSTVGEISADNIHLYRAYYLNVTKPSNRTKNPVGWYPDALIPFSDAGEEVKPAFRAVPISIDTALNAEVWCDLYVPSGTKPGIYTGAVTVTLGKKKIAKIPVTLSVRDFELPEKISMPSHFGSLTTAAIQMMGIDSDSLAIVEMTGLYNDELLKHRAVPSTPAYVWPEWNEKDGLVERGEAERMKKLVETDHFNALDIPFRYVEEPKKCVPYLKAVADWLRKLGYLSMAYVYMEDEPNTKEQYDIVRKQGEMIKEADPEIGRMCTEQTLSSNPEWGDLYGAVSVWCPLWGIWDEKTASERLALGEKLWSYTALCQRDERTPWWQIDMEPLNFRSPFWISWHYDITGFLYWSSTWWNTYGSLEGVWEAPYFRKNFWGEGMLLYPGKPAGIQGFVPSIRLKLYREAMEDYEYMTLAAKSGKTEEVDKIVDGIATSFQLWSSELPDYEKAREALAGIILSAK